MSVVSSNDALTQSISIPPTQTLATDAAFAAMQAEAQAVTGATTETSPASPNSRMFSEEELEAARRQEKDKLYSKLTKLEEELEAIRLEREAAAEQARAAAEAEDEARRQREEAEMSAKELLAKKEDEFNARINTAQQEWEQKFQALQEESEARAAMLEKERIFQELNSYKQRRLNEEQEHIIPELLADPDAVRGESVEEIEASIQKLLNTSSAIMQHVQPLMQQAQQRPRGISPTGGIPSGPLDNGTEQQTITVSDVKGMSMEQWAQVRGRLGLK